MANPLEQSGTTLTFTEDETGQVKVNYDDMPQYGSTGMTYKGFKGDPWPAKIGDEVILRNNHHSVGWGWIVVGKSEKSFSDPILYLKHDNGSTRTSLSCELVKKKDWWRYYGQSDLRRQDIWQEDISKSN